MLKIDAKLVTLREKLEAEPDAHARAAISDEIRTLETANAILEGKHADEDEARKAARKKSKAEERARKKAAGEDDEDEEDDAADEDDEEDEKARGKRTRALLRITQAALLAATSAHRPPAPHPDEANQRFMDPAKEAERKLCAEFKDVGISRGILGLRRNMIEYGARMKAGA